MRIVPPATTFARLTNDDLYAAMVAANPASPAYVHSTTSETPNAYIAEGEVVQQGTPSPKAHIFVSSPPSIPPVVRVNNESFIPANLSQTLSSGLPGALIETVPSIPASAVSRRVTNDQIFAAMSAATPKLPTSTPAAVLKPLTQLAPAASKQRPETTMIVARRMIGRDLGIKLDNQKENRLDTITSNLKKPGSPDRKSELNGSVHSGESRGSGVMCMGLGGSRWASAESQMKALPRPIEDIFELQDEGMRREIQRINETQSLSFEPTPGAMPFREKVVLQKVVVAFLEEQKRDMDDFAAAQQNKVDAFLAGFLA